MKVTAAGQQRLTRAMLSAFGSIHLFGTDGEEFNSHGYEPIPLDLDRWNTETGEYGAEDERINFVFQAGDPSKVGGYYLAGLDGAALLIEELPEPFEVEHRGSILRIKLVYPLTPEQSQITVEQ